MDELDELFLHSSHSIEEPRSLNDIMNGGIGKMTPEKQPSSEGQASLEPSKVDVFSSMTPPNVLPSLSPPKVDLSSLKLTLPPVDSGDQIHHVPTTGDQRSPCSGDVLAELEAQDTHGKKVMLDAQDTHGKKVIKEALHGKKFIKEWLKNDGLIRPILKEPSKGSEEDEPSIE